MLHALLGAYTYLEFGLTALAFVVPMGLVTLLKGKSDPGMRLRGRWMRRFGRMTARLSPIWRFSVDGTPPPDILSRGYVVILHENMHDARVIPTDGRPHLPSEIRLRKGDPRGRWEGDTLVVDSTNFITKTWLTGVPIEIVFAVVVLIVLATVAGAVVLSRRERRVAAPERAVSTPRAQPIAGRGTGLAARVRDLFRGGQATEETWAGLEETLIRADVGPAAARTIVQGVRESWRSPADP